MSVPIKPRPLTPTEFTTMSGNWQKLMASGDVGTLRTAFANSTPELSNYAYLPAALVVKLLSGLKTVAIRTKFVLADASPTFSLAVYGIDPAGVATTPHFLMGMAAVPASIKNVMGLLEMDAEIPAAQAAAWIMAWHGLNAGNLTMSPFDSAYGRLLGYTFSLDDFRLPWPESPAPDAALWLNFDMHAPAGAPASPPLFSNIVTLNTVPVGEVPGVITLAPNLRYFDVSQPCPPMCTTYTPQPGK